MERSIEQVRDRAKKIGVHRNWKDKEYFTEDEKEIIKKYYVKEKDDIVKRLPFHTIEGIKLCAVRIGLHTKKWTNEEIDILQKYYSTNLDLCIKLIQQINPRRNLGNIASKANTLGLVRINYWSKEEDEIILKYYAIEGCDFVYKLLGGKRNKPSIMTRASKLGIKQQPLWSEEELKILHRFYPSEGQDIIKRLPNKNASQIASKAQSLKLKSNTLSCPRNRKWSLEEDEIIKKFYPHEGKLCASRLSQRNEKAVQQRASLLGIKYGM